MQRKPSFLLLSAAIASALASAAQADQPAPVELDTLQVTATRTPQALADSLAAVTVITRADIEQLQARSLLEVLNGQAGIQVANLGGFGKSSSVFIRGTESDHVLVLIDGVKIGSATNGSVAFQDLPIEQIERIEIVRGPRSGLYGSEAIGGVIQIFTRKGRQRGQTSNASIGYGNYETTEFSLGFSNANENGRLAVQASAFDTQGIDAREGSETDKDGFKNRSASISFQHHLNDKVSISADALRAEGHTEFDGSSQNETDFVQQSANAALDLTISDSWDLSLRAGQSRDEQKSLKDGDLSSIYDTRRDSYSLQNNLYIASSIITVGADYLNDQVTSTDNFTKTERDNLGAFAQWQASLGPLSWSLTGRQDDNEAFGKHETGNISLGLDLFAALRLTASYGTSFKAPDFNDLYSPWGNPDLKPEESEAWEVGLGQYASWGNWQVSAFRTESDNMTIWVNNTADLSSWDWSPINADVRIEGIESNLAANVAGWNTALSLTYLDTEERDTGKELARRAKLSGRADINRQFERLNLGLSLVGQGRRFSDPGNFHRLPAYILANLQLSYKLTRNLEVKAKVDNVFDKDYQSAIDYNALGRTYFASIHYTVE